MTQEKISRTRILVAGCGIGSQLAEAAARVGFQHFTLIDGDQVSLSNLNRQSYTMDDLGENKAVALARHLIQINPQAQVKAIADNLGESNVRELISESDLIFDTIDFLDLSAILTLHDEAFEQGKHLISAVGAGWGAVALYFPPEKRHQAWIRDLFGIPKNSTQLPSYAHAFAGFFASIQDRVDPKVLEVFGAVIKSLEEGQPCPAPQVGPGAYSVAALGITMAVRILAGLPVISAPDIVTLESHQATYLPQKGSRVA